VGDLLGSGAALAGVGGGLIYALVAIAYQVFYGGFGVSPSDVGISQSDIIAQAAVALAYVGALTFLVGLFFYGVSVLLFKLFQSERWRFNSPWVEWIVVIGLAGSYVAAGYFFLFKARFPVLGLPSGELLTILGLAFITSLAILAARRKGHCPPRRGVILVSISRRHFPFFLWSGYISLPPGLKTWAH
jgi:hypothetical protein